MRKTVLAVALAALAAGPAAAEQKDHNSWACEENAPRFERKTIAEIAQNKTMHVIIEQYMAQWDATHIRKQCEAFARGEPHSISCLNGRRDWDAIEASVPKDYFRMDREALRPILSAAREKRDLRNDAIDYCREVGAVPVWAE